MIEKKRNIRLSVECTRKSRGLGGTPKGPFESGYGCRFQLFLVQNPGKVSLLAGLPRKGHIGGREGYGGKRLQRTGSRPLAARGPRPRQLPRRVGARPANRKHIIGT